MSITQRNEENDFVSVIYSKRRVTLEKIYFNTGIYPYFISNDPYLHLSCSAILICPIFMDLVLVLASAATERGLVLNEAVVSDGHT